MANSPAQVIIEAKGVDKASATIGNVTKSLGKLEAQAKMQGMAQYARDLGSVTSVFDSMGGVIGKVAGGLKGLSGLVVSNPIAALATGGILAITKLYDLWESRQKRINDELKNGLVAAKDPYAGAGRTKVLYETWAEEDKETASKNKIRRLGYGPQLDTVGKIELEQTEAEEAIATSKKRIAQMMERMAKEDGVFDHLYEERLKQEKQKIAENQALLRYLSKSRELAIKEIKEKELAIQRAAEERAAKEKERLAELARKEQEKELQGKLRATEAQIKTIQSADTTKRASKILSANTHSATLDIEGYGQRQKELESIQKRQLDSLQKIANNTQQLIDNLRMNNNATQYEEI